MQLSKLSTLVLAGLIGFSPITMAAQSKAKPAKSASKTVIEQKVVVKQKANGKTRLKTTTVIHKKSSDSKKKAVTVQNQTHKLYGIKGAALVPTKVSDKSYTYREKGKVHKTIGKTASRLYSQTGIASYYGGKFHGRKTASGEIYNKNAYTAAHKTLALGSYALVTNLRNGKRVIVKINDRGPFSKERIIDLSVGSAKEIGMLHSGIAKVRVEAMQVDSEGYIIGKGAESLRRLAQKEGLPLKTKTTGNQLGIKADASGKTVTKNQHKVTASHTAKNQSTVKRVKPNLTVITKHEKEARKIATIVKQKAYVEKTGKHYQVVIAVANPAESDKVRKQIAKLAHYQTMTYSAK